ncbi:MAG: helix-turn-helix transcriptional regulator [Rikenellaceae bacterium]
MNEKIAYLMKSEGLTSSRFAEILKIQPSGVSHLLSGRNKPSCDLLQRILTHFPKINPDWLLLDSKQVYRTTSQSAVVTTPPPPQKEPREEVVETPILKAAEELPFAPPVADHAPMQTESFKPIQDENSRNSLSSILEQKQDRVVRVLLFYSDGTCEGFNMR